MSYVMFIRHEPDRPEAAADERGKDVVECAGPGWMIGAATGGCRTIEVSPFWT
jgi:hypothetical protein